MCVNLLFGGDDPNRERNLICPRARVHAGTLGCRELSEIAERDCRRSAADTHNRRDWNNARAGPRVRSPIMSWATRYLWPVLAIRTESARANRLHPRNLQKHAGCGSWIGTVVEATEQAGA